MLDLEHAGLSLARAVVKSQADKPAETFQDLQHDMVPADKRLLPQKYQQGSMVLTCSSRLHHALHRSIHSSHAC